MSDIRNNLNMKIRIIVRNKKNF